MAVVKTQGCPAKNVSQWEVRCHDDAGTYAGASFYIPFPIVLLDRFVEVYLDVAVLELVFHHP